MEVRMNGKGRKLFRSAVGILTSVMMMGAYTTTAMASGIGVIDAKDMLDIHAEANTASAVVGQVMEDGHVAILAKYNDWVQIQAGEIAGWVPAENLVETEISNEEAVAANEQVIAERTGATASEDEFFAEEEVQQDETAALQAEASEAAQNEIEEVQAAEEAARIEAEAQAKAAAEEAAQLEAEAQAALAAQTAAISAEELKLLANIIYCEAGSESYVGKVAVGNVIMNRVKSASQPNTITEVVYAKGQFSPVRNGSLQRALSSDKADAACYQAAIEALAGAQPVGGKLFFRRNNGRSGQVIGHHVFY
ncbi:cell wall hydrolase [Gallintestinimicrobium sp.]|uniref:cell wall hydrolase n=1 Tax=Gallintestinimicrobium sp. TaxID=2981655 RepID=UPI003AB5E0AC